MKAVRDAAPLGSRKQLSFFLSNYFALSEIHQKLREYYAMLIRKDLVKIEIERAISMQESFDTFEETLTTASTLEHFDFEKLFLVESDAWKEALGPVLFHLDGKGREHMLVQGYIGINVRFLPDLFEHASHSHRSPDIAATVLLVN